MVHLVFGLYRPFSCLFIYSSLYHNYFSWYLSQFGLVHVLFSLQKVKKFSLAEQSGGEADATLKKQEK